MMSSADFIHLVWQMREAQKRYFQRRDIQSLKMSKNLESQVDQAVRELQGLPL